MNSARFVVADVFDGLATLDDESVDLVVTSPPFLALRSYLPADHPDKAKEIGSEPTPAEFIDTMLAVVAELRRVLAPHGSICIEIGDTYAGSGGAGGDYNDDGLREGQPVFDGAGARARSKPVSMSAVATADASPPPRLRTRRQLSGWPLAKSKCLIPESLAWALAYGMNPFTGAESPAGEWRVRNIVDWCRPNPPVGALGDKWRPATSDVIVACVSDKRYWDDLATRRPSDYHRESRYTNKTTPPGQRPNLSEHTVNSGGAPLLDYWEIPPTGYKGSHYAVFPPSLVEPLVKAMAPPKVCRTCGKPSRRIVETTNAVGKAVGRKAWMNGTDGIGAGHVGEIDVQANDASIPDHAERVTTGWTDCGHDDFRPSLILDPFAGSGTTLEVAVKWGHDAVGFDLDERNADLARERVGDSLFHKLEVVG